MKMYLIFSRTFQNQFMKLRIHHLTTMTRKLYSGFFGICLLDGAGLKGIGKMILLKK